MGYKDPGLTRRFMGSDGFGILGLLFRLGTLGFGVARFSGHNLVATVV